MTAGSVTLFRDFAQYAVNGTIDLAGDAIYCALYSSSLTPDVETQGELADLAGALTTANGYTAGGAALASKTTLRAAGVMTFDAADVVWTASGGSITARYLVLYASVARDGFTNPLIGYALLDTTPADVTATDTNTLTIQWSASGIFTAIV